MNRAKTNLFRKQSTIPTDLLFIYLLTYQRENYGKKATVSVLLQNTPCMHRFVELEYPIRTMGISVAGLAKRLLKISLFLIMEVTQGTQKVTHQTKIGTYLFFILTETCHESNCFNVLKTNMYRYSNK